MISFNYFVKTLREHGKFLLLAFLLLVLLQFLIFMMVVEADFFNLAQIFISKFPPTVQHYFSDQWLAQFTISGAVAFGYNHPLVLVFLAIIAIMLPAKHLAGEIEAGTLEILFSLPIKRLDITWSLWLFSAFALGLVIAGCWLGTFIGTLVYPHLGKVPFLRLAQVGINLWLLTLTINGYTFLLSAWTREGSRVTMQAAGVTLFLYFLNYIVKLWPKIGFLHHFTIFDYYQPQKIMLGQAVIWDDVVALTILVVVFIAISFRRLNQRDIPG